MLILLFLFSTQLYASKCEEASSVKSVDLSKEFGPIRDQDGTGWCYAFAGADILGHRIAKKNKDFDIKKREDQVSAVAMSLAFNKDERLRRYHDFELDMNMHKKLSDDPKIKSKLETKLNNFRAKMKRASLKIIPKSSNLRKLLTKYNDALDICRRDGEDSYCEAKLDLGIDRIRVENRLQSDMDYFELVMNFDETAAELQKVKDHLEKFGNKPPIYLEQDGGFSYEAINNMLLERVCLENEVPSYDYKYSKQFKNIISGDHKKLSEVVIAVEKMNELLNKSFHVMTKTLSVSKEKACLSAKVGQMIFPTLEVDEIAQILKHGLSSEYDPLDELYKRSCKKKNINKKELGKLKKNILNATITKDFLIADIDKTLDKGDPVVLDYKSEIFDFGEELLDQKISESEFGHASVIVGKSFNCSTGEVDYMIRNSWGHSSCEQSRLKYRTNKLSELEVKMDADIAACDLKCEMLPVDISDDVVDSCFDKYSKVEDHFHKLQQKSVPYTCKNGHYIIPKSLLKKGISDTVHF